MATGTRPKPSLIPGLPPPSTPFEEAVAQILNGHALAGATQRTVGQPDIAPLASKEYVEARRAVEVVKVIDAAGLTTVEFIDGQDGVEIKAGYGYRLGWAGLVTTDDDEGVRFRVGDSGGFKTTGYQTAFTIMPTGGTVAQPYYGTALAAVRMTGETTGGRGYGNDTGENGNGSIRFSGETFVSSNLYCLLGFDGEYIAANGVGSGAVWSVQHGIGLWTGGTGALDRIQLLTENGNGFTAGLVWLERTRRAA